MEAEILLADKKNLADKIKEHIVDSTALNTLVNPIFGTLETCVYGMSDEISINARLLGSGLIYAGMGSVISKGRELYRKKFDITSKTSESLQAFHDAVYFGVFNGVFGPLFYFASGSRNIEEITYGTLGAIATGIGSGWPTGYAIDVYKDLTGFTECNRKSYPKFIKNAHPKVKKMLAGALAIGSIAIMAGIYSLTKDNIDWNNF